MILPDVNVLIYAFRPDATRHAASKSWLDAVLAGDARFGLSRLALSAVVRVTTHRRFFPQPSTLEESFRFCDHLISQPHCEIVEPGENHWPIFRQLCVDTNTRGPNVSDVWFAALAIEHSCTWITFDRDYARFPRLDWREPA